MTSPHGLEDYSFTSVQPLNTARPTTPPEHHSRAPS
eukprot:CAMPEP_0182941110 /NCGR_PEP_ID=MMETSP0105_2-20130417/48442_1 /TAXON_ID=81532 ORGANISM="Acanthoeca-like sp., Strain 10tr" /NCGR_SAMPLE_ID=MMETSP0105_2 /ASSEMBLY_ACC=CAM_ASM_000205 /LENGTH=35 /DNA_ID= /DNA_START= /DNA_END= /DNA_ORIENTATION=